MLQPVTLNAPSLKIDKVVGFLSGSDADRSFKSFHLLQRSRYLSLKVSFQVSKLMSQ